MHVCVCIVSSPAPRLYWSKRGGTLPSHGRYERPANRFNSELEIYNLRQSDEGDYVCRADNEHGSQQTVIRLDVQGRPTILLALFFHYVAAKATYIRLLHGKIGFLGGFSALVSRNSS